MLHQDVSTTRCQDDMSPNNVSPTKKSRTFRPLHNTSLGHVVPDQYVLILNCINVLVKISYFGLCFAMLWRVWTTGACAAAPGRVCTCTSAPAALVWTTCTSLCCSWMFLDHKCQSCTSACLDNRSLVLLLLSPAEQWIGASQGPYIERTDLLFDA